MSLAGRKIVNSPQVRSLIGKKYLEQATQWVSTTVTFGLASTVVMLYFTDWKVVNEYIPFYNTKFRKDE